MVALTGFTKSTFQKDFSFKCQSGERASLTGQRKSDFLSEARSDEADDSTSSPKPDDREGLNLVLLIQVPLKQKEPMFNDTVFFAAAGDTGIIDDCLSAESDVEEAVIGHGKVEGPFTEIDGLEIERDDKFPVRVTVQFYKATSNGVVSEHDIRGIADQINKVYKQADYVGSLVVDGPTGRPTEYQGTHVEPPQWWDVFWQRHCENTGQTREQAIEMLRKLLGERWQESTLEQAEQAVSQTGPDASPE